MIQAFSFETDSIYFQGHFPAHPILPGFVILQQIKSLFLDNFVVDNAPPLVNFTKVKFLKPVLAEQVITVSFATLGPKLIDFTCREQDFVVAKGRLHVVDAS